MLKACVPLMKYDATRQFSKAAWFVGYLDFLSQSNIEKIIPALPLV